MSPELLDEIVFAMENQERKFRFDVTENLIVPATEIEDPDPDRYIELPEWNSIMGFHLMERFVGSLRNPPIRDVLREALSSGQGVFRKYKNALKEQPEIESLWFRFKVREMRRIVMEWLDSYSEMVGLDSLAIEDEDTTELVFSDFRIGPPSPGRSDLMVELAARDRLAFFEMYHPLEEAIVETLFHRSRRGSTPGADEVLVSETPDGVVAGFIWFEEVDSDGKKLGFVRQLAVSPEFRGLQIARALLEAYLAHGVDHGLSRAFLEIGPAVSGFSRLLLALGFEEFGAWYQVSIRSI